MSALKQMEEMKLTPEEIQELVILLEGVLPKIEGQVKRNNQFALLTKNLSSKLGVDTGINVIDNTNDLITKAEDMNKGYTLLISAKNKLTEINKQLKDLFEKS